MNFANLFINFNLCTNRKYFETFKCLKPFVLQKLKETIHNNRKHQTGRPITTDLNAVIDAVYYLCESGAQFGSVENLFHIPKSTFYRYFNLINQSKLFERIYQQIIESIPPPNLLITDTFTVKSMRGSIGLGRNPTDRGRKGLKVSIICDPNRITHAVHLAPANVHDSKLLIHTIRKLYSIRRSVKPVICLADSGYIGKQLANDCLQHHIKLVAKPKKVNHSGKLSHILDPSETILIQKLRNRIELLNGQIRHFRSLMIKWVQSISSYSTFLFVSLLCITTHQLFV